MKSSLHAALQSYVSVVFRVAKLARPPPTTQPAPRPSGPTRLCYVPSCRGLSVPALTGPSSHSSLLSRMRPSGFKSNATSSGKPDGHSQSRPDPTLTVVYNDLCHSTVSSWLDCGAHGGDDSCFVPRDESGACPHDSAGYRTGARQIFNVILM